MAPSPPHGEGRSTAQRFTIGLTVNGRRVEATAPPRKLLPVLALALDAVLVERALGEAWRRAGAGGASRS